MTVVGYVIEDFKRLEEASPGVGRKVLSQVSTMKRAGLDCNVRSVCKRSSWGVRLVKRLPFGSDGLEWSVDLAEGCDVLYVRRPRYFSNEFRQFLVDSRKANPDLRVVVELPTFPYDREYGLLSRPLVWKDRKVREKLTDIVDRFVDYSREGKVFGVSALRAINGIDLDAVHSRNVCGVVSGESIDVVCAAAFAEWHGIDRLLAGLAKRKKSEGGREVRFHLMGEGPELPRLKEMADDLALGDSVVFYGQCDRAQMDEVYDRCSLAIECLGIHRKGLAVSSSLKSREYLAKGIPFVYSGKIDVFEDDPVDFCLQVPADESPVDIGNLVEFHDEIYQRESEQELISRIRCYAEEHVGMDAAMANVIEYIKENCR